MKYYIKDGQVKREDLIVITKDGFKIYRPTEEMILAYGWTEYTFPDPKPRQPTQQELLMDLQMAQFNLRTDISDDDAIRYALIVYPWNDYIGKELKTGKVVTHDNSVWRVRQDVSVVLEGQEPGIYTAALYERIDYINHEGTKEDPIPYRPPMELYKGYYYKEDETLYECIEGTGQAISHKLSELAASQRYVQVAQ